MTPAFTPRRGEPPARSAAVYQSRASSFATQLHLPRGATPKDFRVLPKRIVLVRHAESEGNIDNFAYTYVPDPQVPLVSHQLQEFTLRGQLKQLAIKKRRQ